jgi:hypothetical protein
MKGFVHLGHRGDGSAFAPARSGSLRPLLVRDHERLELLFVAVLDQFRGGDWDELRAMWTRFEAGLTAHLEVEERYLLPLFVGVDPAEAAALLAEHGAFRKALDELGVGVALHSVSLAVAQGFVDALRAHAHRENQLFYRWVDRRIDASGRQLDAPRVSRDWAAPDRGASIGS